MSPKIAIDVTPLENPRPTGVERLLLGAIQSLAERDDDFDLHLVSRRPIEWPFALPEQFATAVVPGGRIALWRERELTRWLVDEGVHLFHSPVTALPIRGAFHRIATVHEIFWKHAPGSEAMFHRFRLRIRVGIAVRCADRILAPSATTKDDLASVEPKLADRITVISPGVHARFFEPGDAELDAEVLRSYGVPQSEYLLAVGKLRRKKNLGRTIEIAARLATSRPRGPALVLVGAAGDATEEIRRLASDLGVGDVVLPGFVADEHLPAIYRGAAVLLHPSRSEGFGFPPLEAMATGTPVVASRAGAVPEAVGDAAVLLEPDDVDGFARETARVLDDFTHRSELVRRGKSRAKRFGWDVFGEALADLYRSVLAQPRVRA